MPVYLDGAKQVIANAGFDSNVASWNGLTSSVEVSNDLAANGTLRLGVPNYYGTVVFVVNKDAAQSVTVSDYTSGSDSTVRVLNAEQESVTVLYNGSNWVEIAASESSAGTTGTNLTLSGTLDVTGAAEFAGNVGFYGTTAVARPASANQAAVTITDVSAHNADVDTNLDNLATLVNQLRADLIALGLIKGSA